MATSMFRKKNPSHTAQADTPLPFNLCSEGSPSHFAEAPVEMITAQSFAYLKESRKITYHTVRRGENLGVISRKYKVPINTICKLNKISTKSVLRVGQRLRIR